MILALAGVEPQQGVAALPRGGLHGARQHRPQPSAAGAPMHERLRHVAPPSLQHELIKPPHLPSPATRPRPGSILVTFLPWAGTYPVNMQDAELLREYARNGSEAAFSELVSRHVSLVYSTARRQVGDADSAKDIAQAVFCLLARKAGALARRRTLAGWLYRATCFTAARARRGEQRRRQREQEVVEMSQINPNIPNSTGGDSWGHLSPLLDQALNQLGETDRAAVLLRFFQGKSMGEVGEALGLSEASAKMRVSRSVERMREFFARRGVACSGSALAALLAEKGAEAVPAALARSIAAAARSGAAPAALASLSLLQNLALMTGVRAGVLMTAVICGLVVAAGAIHFYSAVRSQAGGGDKAPAEASGTALEHRGGRGVSGATLGGVPAEPAPTRPAREASDLNAAIERLRAALHAPRTQTTLAPGITNAGLYPPPGVVDAIQGLVGHPEEAFEVLKGAAGEQDDEVRMRAVSGLGRLGKAVPQAASVLWDIARAPLGPGAQLSSWSPSDQAGGQPPGVVLDLGTPTTLNGCALVALAGIGFSASDLPSLAEALGSVEDDSVRGNAPKYIADTIRNDPAAAEPFIPAVQGLLSHTNAEVRFAAACALAQSRRTQDPRVFREIGVRLELLSQPASSEFVQGLSVQMRDGLTATEALQGAGPSAKSLVPILLRLARSIPVRDDVLRQRALQAVGSIDGSLRTELPEVDEALRAEESSRMDRLSLPAGTYSFGDLLALLKDPQLGPVVAAQFSQAGPTNIGLLPQIVEGYYAQTNPLARRKMLESIHRISPSFSPEQTNRPGR